MIDIIIILVSLSFSGFFSGMEIAFIASNRLRLEIEKKEKNLRAGLLSMFTKNEALYIATMLIGNNIALVIYGVFMGKQLEPLLHNYVDNEIIILLLQTLFSTIIILITAEFLPKSIFRNNANSALKIFAFPVTFFILIFYPIAQFTIALSNIIVKFFFKVNISASNGIVFGKIDLNNFVEEVNEEFSQDEDIDNEIKIFQNALDFSNVKIRECLVPRNEIEAIEVNQSIVELKNKFIDTGYSRVLVYENNIDNIIGYVHQSELFKNPANIHQVISTLIIVPETMSAKKLLDRLIRESKNLALVVDEFGGTSGIVSLEDIMEEIFGEIEDEHDTQEFIDKKINENTFLFSGRLEIDYINEKYNLNLPESEEFETIAGFVVLTLGYIPVLGEKIKINNFEITIKQASSSKIELLELVIL